MTKQLLIIFRIPNDPETGQPLFVEAEYTDGKMASSGHIFQIDDPEDSYLTMDWNHIVLAEKVDVGSIDICRFAIDDDKAGGPAIVCELAADALYAIVDEIVANHAPTE